MNKDKIDLLATYFALEMTRLHGEQFSFTEKNLLALFEGDAISNDAEEASCSTQEVEAAMSFLEERGIIESFSHRYTATRYNLVENWRDQLSRHSESIESLRPASKYGYPWIFEALDNMDGADSLTTEDEEQPTTAAPASDRLVALDHNQAAFDEFQHDLIGLFDALKSNAQETNLSEEDRLFLLGQLDAARRMIEASPVVTVSGLNSVLLPPIKYITEKVTAGIIGAKAAAILDFLQTFVN